MAKLKYNATLVQNTLDELGDASNQLVNTEEEMRSALTIIANAQGIHHVHTDTLFNTLGFPVACQEMIEDTITSLKTRASEIEAYNEEYENASVLEKIGATAGLFITKLCEGFASAGEQIVDGFASVIGLGVGLVSKDAQESIGNFIEKDHVGDFFNNLYDTSLKGMVIRSWASEKGIACNIFKGLGTGLGYAAALATTGAITGGLSTGTMLGAKVASLQLMSSLPAAVSVAGLAGIGAGTQTGLKGGLDYSDAFCYGLKYGAIQAGTTIVFSYAFKTLAKGWNLLKTKIKGSPNSTSLTVIDDAAGAAKGSTGSTTSGTTGGSTGGATGTTAKAGLFKQSYTAQNGKTYTCLDDVWDDVVKGNLTKPQLRDIIKNTVGIDDSGLGHAFLSDATNVMKGGSPNLGWRTMATSIDDTAAAATGNMTGTGTGTGTSTVQPKGPTTTGTNGMGTVADDMFTASGSSTSTSTSTQLTTNVAKTTAGSGLDDTVAASLDDTVGATASAKKQLNAIRNSMNEMGENLIKDKNALTAAQTALDDAIASGADDATIASLRKSVEKAQTTYNGQHQRLLAKQQQYVELTQNGQFDAVGTSKYKLIVGDDVVAGPNSTAGDITTMRAGTTTSDGIVEYRPNWTQASAKAEGQINAKEFAKLLDDQYGPVVPTTAPTSPTTALATSRPTGVATIPPKGSAPLVTIPPKGSAPLVTIPPKGPTGLAPTIAPTIVPTIAPTIAPPITPIKGDTVIFGVVQPEEIIPTPSIEITPASVIPVSTPEPIIDIPETIIDTPKPVITPPAVTTASPVITTPLITTAPPVITTPPITTAPPVITTPPAVTDSPVITNPPIDQEYVPIPNTGIGGNSSSPRMGFAPIAAGAVAGLAGVVGGSLLSKMNQKYYDEDEEKAKEKEESEE